jgi:acyl-ACP thioesterase
MMSEIILENGLFEMPVQVSSYFLDSSKRLSAVALAEILQEAAGGHAHAEGFGYHQFEPKSLVWILTAMRFEVLQWPIWEQSLIVRTWVVDSQRFISRRDFQILNQQGELLISASTHWLLYNFDKKRPTSIDNAPIHVQRHPTKLAVENPISKEFPRVKPSNAFSFKVEISDLDMLGHMNNTRYIQHLIDSYDWDFYQHHQIKSFEIHFLSEAKLGETLQSHRQQVDSLKLIHEIFNQSGEKSHCVAIIQWQE